MPVGGRSSSGRRSGVLLVYLDHGQVTLDCKILEIDTAHRLVHSFTIAYDPEAASDRPSRVTWEIEKMGDACRLTLVHDDFDGVTKTYREVEHGWSQILSGLKTLIETGQSLAVGEPAEEHAEVPA